MDGAIKCFDSSLKSLKPAKTNWKIGRDQSLQEHLDNMYWRLCENVLNDDSEKKLRVLSASDILSHAKYMKDTIYLFKIDFDLIKLNIKVSGQAEELISTFTN